MRVSKYVNLDANILMEYIYDDANLISEPYEILINTKDVKNSFLSTTSGSLNTIDNQLFLIDSISRKYGIVNTSNYSFLQVNNYSSGFPLKYDTVVIHLPINYTFGNNIGFYLRVYAYDKNNTVTYDLCNYFYDITDIATKGDINYTNPPFLYNETLWGKELSILIPSLNAISSQVNSNITIPNSLNFNLTNGVGLNQQSPIFFEFSFINISQTINNIKTYLLGSKFLTNVPQIPEFKQLGVVIEPATDGDYFEIYGIYDGTIAEFNTFINNSVYIGNRYYVTYTITMYEQNIRGNSLTLTVTNNFNIPIEYRPIIKYSSTTAVIDVEMNLIDAVDGSSIVRKASYGMLQDQVSKFSRYLSKINLLSASKPVIYNSKSGNGNSNYQVAPVNNITTVSVPFSVLIDSAKVVAKSDNVVAGSDLYYGEGKLMILIKPFDTIIKITLYQDVSSQNGTAVSTPFDLTSFGQIQLTFKNTQTQYNFPLYLSNGDINLSKGTVVFMVPSSSITNLRTMLQSGSSVFYITSTQQNMTTVLYSGLFDMYDSSTNISNLINAAVAQIAASAGSSIQIETTATTTTTTTTDTLLQSLIDEVATLTANQASGGIKPKPPGGIKLVGPYRIDKTLTNSNQNIFRTNLQAGLSDVTNPIVIDTFGTTSGDDSGQGWPFWKATPSGGVWSSSNPTRVSIEPGTNGQALLQLHYPGEVDITYTYNGQSVTKQFTVTHAIVSTWEQH